MKDEILVTLHKNGNDFELRANLTNLVIMSPRV